MGVGRIVQEPKAAAFLATSGNVLHEHRIHSGSRQGVSLHGHQAHAMESFLGRLCWRALDGQVNCEGDWRGSRDQLHLCHDSGDGQCEGGQVVNMSKKGKEWIAVDLDGTLAVHDGWRGINHIGKPIYPMVDVVKGWLDEGANIKIFTARTNGNGLTEEVKRPIRKWCKQHLGKELEITNIKDFSMAQLWDDRAKQLPMSGVAGILMEAATTYQRKNGQYKGNYEHIGNLLLALFAHTGGIPHFKTAEELNRLYLIIFCLAKLQRYCSLFETGGHKDSAHDLIVYAGMLEDMTKEKT